MRKNDIAKVFDQVIALMKGNPDIERAISKANLEWSDGRCIDPFGVYGYLTAIQSAERELYMSFLRYTAQVSEKGGE